VAFARQAGNQPEQITLFGKESPLLLDELSLLLNKLLERQRKAAVPFEPDQFAAFFAAGQTFGDQSRTVEAQSPDRELSGCRYWRRKRAFSRRRDWFSRTSRLIC
jgi:hypothetical protein